MTNGFEFIQRSWLSESTCLHIFPLSYQYDLWEINTSTLEYPTSKSKDLHVACVTKLFILVCQALSTSSDCNNPVNIGCHAQESEG